MKSILTLFSVTFLFLACGTDKDDDPCVKKTCADFATYEDAQAAFDMYPNCYASLDGDNDGEACEGLKD